MTPNKQRAIELTNQLVTTIQGRLSTYSPVSGQEDVLDLVGYLLRDIEYYANSLPELRRLQDILEDEEENTEI